MSSNELISKELKDVFNILLSHNETIAVIEVLTGGLIMNEMTSISEYDQVFDGGIVIGDMTKLSLLEIHRCMISPKAVIDNRTSVELANNIRLIVTDNNLSTYGISVTGSIKTDVSGKCSTDNVYIGISCDKYKSAVGPFAFTGTRDQIKRIVVHETIRTLYDVVTSYYPLSVASPSIGDHDEWEDIQYQL